MQFKRLATILAVSNALLGVSAGPLLAKRQGKYTTVDSEVGDKLLTSRLHRSRVERGKLYDHQYSVCSLGGQYYEQWRADDI